MVEAGAYLVAQGVHLGVAARWNDSLRNFLAIAAIRHEKRGQASWIQ